MSILPKGIKLWVQEGPSNLHFVWYPGYACTVELSRQCEVFFKFNITMVKDEMFIYAYNEKDMLRIGNIILDREMKDKDYSKNLIRKWKKLIERYYGICNRIDNTELKSLSDEELMILFQEFTETYIKEYASPILADAMGYFCECELSKVLTERLKEVGREKEYNWFLTVLSQPVKEGFISQEKRELLEITSSYKENKDIQEKIMQHAKKWFWMQNNYLREITLDYDYFFNRVLNHSKADVKKEISQQRNRFLVARKEKARAIEELNVDKRFKTLIKLLDIYTHWQDVRKKANLIAQHYLTLFLNEISRRKNIPFEDMIYTLPDEVAALLEGEKVNLEEIKLRKMVTGVIFLPEKVSFFKYEDSKRLYEEVQKQNKSNGVTGIFGSVANMGKVIGNVKIIRNTREFVKLKQGDILVTSMTRPEFIPILKKAAAIVTDEGGLTCHAAIVARELNVACIVGTRIATKVLKDGEKVEVNANHGVVRRLEK